MALFSQHPVVAFLDDQRDLTPDRRAQDVGSHAEEAPVPHQDFLGKGTEGLGGNKPVNFVDAAGCLEKLLFLR